MQSSDEILGKREDRQTIKKLSVGFLVPRARRTNTAPGQVMDVHVRYIVPDFHYARRKDILGLLDKNILVFCARLPTTNYMRRSGRWFNHLRKALEYRRLYSSIAQKGFLNQGRDPFAVPWLFASSKFVYRLDGHHRASIARQLGYETMKARVITPADLLGLKDLPEGFRDYLLSLDGPRIDLSSPPR